MRQLRILHLSDLHFGHNHRCGPEDPTHPRVGYPLLFDLITKDLQSGAFDDPTWENDERDLSPLLVAVTGDLTEGATPDEFKAAAAFLKRFDQCTLLGTKTSLHDLFVVPGNHDVLYDAEDVETRMTPFTNFYSKVFAGVRQAILPHESDKLTQVITDSKRGFVVAEINSAKYVKKGTPDEKRGSVDMQAIQELDAAFQRIGESALENMVRVALIHHHPILVPDLVETGRGYDAVANSNHLLKLLRRHGFHLVLHGHKHYPHVFSYDSDSAWQENISPAMLVNAGGSASSRELPTGSRRHNTYTLVCIKWHPEVSQARVRLVTRGLISDEGAGELAPHLWKWVTLRDLDKRLYPPRDPPRPTKPQLSHLNNVTEQIRTSIYQEQRGNMAACEVLPSLIPGQAYEARLWIVPHADQNGTPKPGWEPPTKVICSAGPLFASQVCDRKSDPTFCSSYNYWGPMLVQAQLHFADGSIAHTHIYARMPSAKSP